MLEELINEIKQKYDGKISIHHSELREYRDRHYAYCLNQLETKPSGFFGWVSFSNETTRKFNEAFDELNIEIIYDEIEASHGYELKETGLNRLNELEKRIKKELL